MLELVKTHPLGPQVTAACRLEGRNFDNSTGERSLWRSILALKIVKTILAAFLKEEAAI